MDLLVFRFSPFLRNTERPLFHPKQQVSLQSCSLRRTKTQLQLLLFYLLESLATGTGTNKPAAVALVGCIFPNGPGVYEKPKY